MSLSAFNRMRRLKAEEEAKRKATEQEQQPSNDSADETKAPEAADLTPEAVEKMTRAQIMAELKERNINFDQRDNKDKLKGVLLDAIK